MKKLQEYPMYSELIKEGIDDKKIKELFANANTINQFLSEVEKLIDITASSKLIEVWKKDEAFEKQFNSVRSSFGLEPISYK